MPFPTIDYQNPPVQKVGMQLPKGPRTMISILENRDLISRDELAGINNMQELKADLLRRIIAYNEGDDLEVIFHLIQIWGGSTGRNIYVRDGGFVRDRVMPHYTRLVQTCLDIRKINVETMEQIVAAMCQFSENVRNINLAFISKHVHFWLRRNLATNALPIYDSVMACHIMFSQSVRRQDIVPYWQQMIEKATEEKMSVCDLEEILFAYFRPYEE